MELRLTGVTEAVVVAVAVAVTVVVYVAVMNVTFCFYYDRPVYRPVSNEKKKKNSE